MTRNEAEKNSMMRLASLAALVVIVHGIACADEAAARPSAAPPSSYALAEVVFECRRSASQYDDSTITLSGKGTGVRVERAWPDRTNTVSFVADPHEVFELLELRYREHFFELSDSYEVTQSPRLGPAGKIQTLNLMVSDAASETISVRIGNFSKSVTYLPSYGNPPPVVVELSKRLNEIASRPVTK